MSPKFRKVYRPLLFPITDRFQPISANETYSEAKHRFSVRNIDVLMNVQSPVKWWSTLKSAVFGSSSSLPPLVGPGGTKQTFET